VSFWEPNKNSTTALPSDLGAAAITWFRLTNALAGVGPSPNRHSATSTNIAGASWGDACGDTMRSAAIVSPRPRPSERPLRGNRIPRRRLGDPSRPPDTPAIVSRFQCTCHAGAAILDERP